MSWRDCLQKGFNIEKEQASDITSHKLYQALIAQIIIRVQKDVSRSDDRFYCLNLNFFIVNNANNWEAWL